MIYNFIQKISLNMTDLSKFINILIEFSQNIQIHVNKKYKSFIRSTLNLESLAKSVRPDKILLTKELIIFKLGLQAKSPKAVEISLLYLHKLFQMKFIDLTLPNLCQNYIIQESGVKQTNKEDIKTQIRHEILNLIKKNIIYKNPQINLLIIKVLQYLISEPILSLLLEISLQFSHQATQAIIFKYFSFRFLVFQEICYYTEKQIQSFNILTLKTQKTEQQIKNALNLNQQLVVLLSKYMNEYLSIIQKTGGRYGNCVICTQPADHYCKITKASLCGIDCKKKHIQIAQKQYKNYFQAYGLWQGIFQSFTEFLTFLQNHQSPLLFGVLSRLLQKPHLFMITKLQFKNLIRKHIPSILQKALSFKNENYFQQIYIFIVSLTKYWMAQCLSSIEFFFQQYIIKVLEQKKPSMKFLNLIFKALARIFQYGKVTIQLYINFDCEVNKQNLLEKVLFQLSKLIQDRFSNNNNFNKQEKISIKNHCLSIFIIMAMGLNQYRKYQTKDIETSEIIHLKQKKLSLEQFTIRFNEHWTNGLKTLFNLNLVGLDSNEEIVDILMNLKGLNKQNIDQLFFCQKGALLFDIFIKKIIQKNKGKPLYILLNLHEYIPLKYSSIGIKKLIEILSIEDPLIEKQIMLLLGIIYKVFTREQLKKELMKLTKQELINENEIDLLFNKILDIKLTHTIGNNKTFYTHCCSRSYLHIIASQITLLQIPISYLLQTDFQTDRILILVEELIQVCSHSNWISLLVKNTSISKYPSQEFDQNKFKIIMGILNIIEKQAQHIPDWSTIINFLSFLTKIIKKQKLSTDNKIVLHELITIGRIQRCLMEASYKSQVYFLKLILAILVIGKEELQKDNTFMIQKLFQMIDSNLKKFLNICQGFLPYFSIFINETLRLNNQMSITITDMFKQTFAKLLKTAKPNETWVNSCQAQFWKFLQILSNHQSKQVSDFVINCITMSLLHHYDICYKSWIVLFGFMKKKVKQYRQQVYTILQKIGNEKMRNCQEFYSDFIQLCLAIIHPTETKLSIEALHLVRKGIQVICQMKSGQSKGQQIQRQMQQRLMLIRQMNKIILGVVKTLIDQLFVNCHEYIIELMFKLLKFKIGEDYIFNKQKLDLAIGWIYDKVQTNTYQQLAISEKTITYSLNWAFTMKYIDIIYYLEGIIINKYNHLSLAATKCIKTYIQMLNPKNSQQWTLIQSSLLKILTDTQLSNILNLNLFNKFVKYQQFIELSDEQCTVDVSLLMNKMMIQKIIVEVVPNHIKCIEKLKELHQQVKLFNDNVYLRVLLWRRGLGKDKKEPPNLLVIQQAISSKLVIMLQLSKAQELFDFAIQIFKRYCKSSILLQEISSSLDDDNSISKQVSQNYSIYCSYLKQRRVPLLKIINYFLPKLSKICKTKSQQKQMVLQLVQCCKYIQSRDNITKYIRDLNSKSTMI